MQTVLLRRTLMTVPGGSSMCRTISRSSSRSPRGDGRRIVVVMVEASDAEGRHVPDATALVHFTVSVGARLLGVGNGVRRRRDLPGVARLGGGSGMLARSRRQL